MKNLWRADETFIPKIPNWGVGSDHRPIVAEFRRIRAVIYFSKSVQVTKSPSAGRPSCRQVSGGFCIWPSGQIRVAPQRASCSGDFVPFFLRRGDADR